jgi:hypothetical protein
MEYVLVAFYFLLLIMAIISGWRGHPSLIHYIRFELGWKLKKKSYLKKIQKMRWRRFFLKKLLIKNKKKYLDEFYEDWLEKLDRAGGLLFDLRMILECYGLSADKWSWRIIRDKMHEVKRILLDFEFETSK